MPNGTNESHDYDPSSILPCAAIGTNGNKALTDQEIPRFCWSITILTARPAGYVKMRLTTEKEMCQVWAILPFHCSVLVMKGLVGPCNEMCYFKEQYSLTPVLLTIKGKKPTVIMPNEWKPNWTLHFREQLIEALYRHAENHQ